MTTFKVTILRRGRSSVKHNVHSASLNAAAEFIRAKLAAGELALLEHAGGVHGFGNIPAPVLVNRQNGAMSPR